jgi:hypothetical protein
VLLSALVFMPFFGVSFSSSASSASSVFVNITKQNPINIVNPIGKSQIVNETSISCSGFKGSLFNLNQSGDCFSKIVLGFNTPAPVYSVVVAPFAKLITTVSVIRLWFTNHAVIKGFESLPIILTAFISLLLFLVFSRRNIFASNFVFKSFYPYNPSLSLLQVYRC